MAEQSSLSKHLRNTWLGLAGIAVVWSFFVILVTAVSKHGEEALAVLRPREYKILSTIENTEMALNLALVVSTILIVCTGLRHPQMARLTLALTVLHALLVLAAITVVIYGWDLRQRVGRVRTFTYFCLYHVFFLVFTRYYNQQQMAYSRLKDVVARLLKTDQL